MVPDCLTSGGFPFPSRFILRSKWIDAIRALDAKLGQWNPSVNSYICIKHFLPSDLIPRVKGSRVANRLRPNAVPSFAPVVSKFNSYSLCAPRTYSRIQIIPPVKKEIEEDRISVAEVIDDVIDLDQEPEYIKTEAEIEIEKTQDEVLFVEDAEDLVLECQLDEDNSEEHCFIDRQAQRKVYGKNKSKNSSNLITTFKTEPCDIKVEPLIYDDTLTSNEQRLCNQQTTIVLSIPTIEKVCDLEINNSFTCDICQASFSKENFLISHKTNMHNLLCLQKDDSLYYHHQGFSSFMEDPTTLEMGPKFVDKFKPSDPYKISFDHMDEIKLDKDKDERKTETIKNKELRSKLEKIMDFLKISQPEALENLKSITSFEFKCPHCEKIDYGFRRMSGHRKRCSNAKLKGSSICDICGKVVKYVNGHKMKVHTSKLLPLVKCKICNYETRAKYLNRHIRNCHTVGFRSVKNFLCYLCGYRTNFRGNLKNHLKGVHKLESITSDMLRAQEG